MGIFDRFSRKTKTLEQVKISEVLDANMNKTQLDNLKLDLSLKVLEEEREMVSLITTAIAAGDNPNSKFRIVDIQAVDTDKEIAAAIVAAFAANNNPNSHFVLKSIEEVVK